MASLRIAHAYDVGAYVSMQALLRGEGIYVLDIALGGHLTIAGADQGYYIEVLPEDQELARQVLTDNGLGKFLLSAPA